MKRVANHSARPCVQNREAFKANNIFAEWRGDGADARYIVYSYGTHWPLFIWEGGTWYENEEKASVTTSKHRTQIHPHADTIKMSAWRMREIADRGVAGWVAYELSADAA